MGRIRKNHLNIRYAAALVAVVAIFIFGAFGWAHAVLLENRSLSFPNSTASATTTHTLSFTFPTTNVVGSIVLEYCTSPVEALSCTRPPGLDARGAVLASQTGEIGFSILSQTNNVIILSRPPTVTVIQPNAYVFNNVVNPGNIGPFFLRISSYSSSDGTGPKLDYGATAGSINQGIAITAEVPPVLNFCVGVIIPTLCDSAQGNFLELGTLSHTYASVGTTQLGAYTNAEFGYVISMFGETMTSGNNVITGLSAPTPSLLGQRQFGVNLRANTNPAVGAEPFGAGSIGAPAGNYAIPNKYAFKNGDVIAASPTLSEFEIYTVTYLANIEEFQPAGIYNTLINYICTATF